MPGPQASRKRPFTEHSRQRVRHTNTLDFTSNS